MQHAIKAALFAVALAFAAPAAAQNFDAGLEAHRRGDYATALREIRPLAEQGDAEAQMRLGYMYQEGKGVPEDFAEALKWYRLAAEQGLADAQDNLGLMYRWGRGTANDDAAAAKWYRMAAEQGHVGAQTSLGFMYYQGLVVPHDYVQAHMWLTLAASQKKNNILKAWLESMARSMTRSMSPAQIAEAELLAGAWPDKPDAAALESIRARGATEWAPNYWTGLDAYGRKDYAAAVRIWRPLAERGHALAAYYLGWMFESSTGVAQDPAEAANWYLRAAELGHTKAQVSLGFFYLSGFGVARDTAEAVKWLREAAKKENGRAIIELGKIFFLGYGVPQDYVQAYMWWSIAASLGDKGSNNSLNLVADRMDQAQIAEAEQLARDWHRAH